MQRLFASWAGVSVCASVIGASVATEAYVVKADSVVANLAIARPEMSATAGDAQKPDATAGRLMRTSRGIASRRRPSTGLEYVPSADSDYRRTERLRFEIPSDDVRGATGRLLGPADTPVNVPVSIAIRFDETTKRSIVVAELTLAPLAPAEYELELTLDERGDKNIVAYRFGVVP